MDRTHAILPFAPDADHSGKKGYFVTLASGESSLCDAATDVPFGVILEGAPDGARDSIGVSAGGLCGTVDVKLGAVPGAVVAGSILTLNADATVSLDSGAGDRVQVAQAMEAGAANELIEAVLFKPVEIAGE
jgi:hypothetical protein